MNKKDIALTVGGVVATMALAYLFYRMQQRDAAANAAATQAAADAATQAAAQAQQAQEAQASGAYQELAAYYPSVSTPSITGTTTTTDAASTVTTSASTADNGDTGTTIDSTGIDNLLSQIINDFAGSITTQGAQPETVASMTIPTITSVSGDDLSGIPITAQQAQEQAPTPTPIFPGGSPGGGPIAIAGGAAYDPTTGVVTPLSGAPPYQVDPGTFGYNPTSNAPSSTPVPLSMISNPAVTSHPTAAHPIASDLGA